MNNHYLNQECSFEKVPKNIVKKNSCCSPWLNFFNQQSAEHQIFSLKQHDVLIFDANSTLYIILAGCLIVKKVFRNRKKIILNLLTSEDTFGHTQFASSHFYYEVEAIDVAQIVSIEYSTIMSICQNHHKFSVFFIDHLLLCSIKANRFMEIISHKSITNRLVSLLLLLSEHNGISQSNGIFLNLAITHRVLAQIIGSNRVSITRIMSELVQTKLISIQKKKVIIHDPILLSQRFFK
ncbi:Ycf28 (chloroplast) [Porphyra umbilicalis]|uniref:Ycf28 n=1 Tax=Porphyra umbilicalis TaxID=2786 RepID=J7F7L1_PORUM|nr:Ycf28 [Porphyra umbilicalis]AFC40010.1 Ycf28 [Porphyra umbilicalis]ASN78814.1 Ycf28 [Porphyra umbilicalis]|eukprot:ASN78814.1 Ycf28 (chloroplast) [Porphyra umbilicalis]